jgi:hypothetical protein
VASKRAINEAACGESRSAVAIRRAELDMSGGGFEQ